MDQFNHFPPRALPLYSPSPPSPRYSEDPAGDETRLEASPRLGARVTPRGIFTKAFGSTTVVLFGQALGAQVASYGRQATAEGTLILEQDTRQISEIVVKLEGRLHIVTEETGALRISTIEVSCPLWAQGPGAASSHCPERLDFACRFPATFKHESREYPLPPSFASSFCGFPLLLVKCVYSLIVSITKERRLGFLPKTKIVHVPLEYHPLTFPPFTLPTPPRFLSAVKLMPEQWHQSSFVMHPRPSSKPKSRLAAIECQVFIPAVRTFGLRDTIPLHLQICAPLASLRALLPPGDGPISEGCSPVRVYLRRKVAFVGRGAPTTRVLRIGEAHVKLSNQPECRLTPAGVQTLDWECAVRCGPAGTAVVGGFCAAGLVVTDEVVVELSPPRPAFASLLPVQHTLPIRLVTEALFEPA
ncbi:hypothetical protein B0H15DRAFT_842000 [Mycena belliarum]|uniref:Uncharacterized protein n=1 Tax=Mycena belliarum TaxID=1033014 RepID=A0AAD6U329_9AGAR|nr:hypothetical protein B0H15DRAFT_842000 [Mycena belliae]